MNLPGSKLLYCAALAECLLLLFCRKVNTFPQHDAATIMCHYGDGVPSLMCSVGKRLMLAKNIKIWFHLFVKCAICQQWLSFSSRKARFVQCTTNGGPVN
ncbi:hypothetical protein XENOCAPTIV_004333 [Xenoophorus captivus]|uniref:Secreted protein n=1 Tax=Xenoophorus captivus TaxID=1517983 RepID=A0ABV0QGH1_9TELE